MDLEQIGRKAKSFFILACFSVKPATLELNLPVNLGTLECTLAATMTPSGALSKALFW